MEILIQMDNLGIHPLVDLVVVITESQHAQRFSVWEHPLVITRTSQKVNVVQFVQHPIVTILTATCISMDKNGARFLARTVLVTMERLDVQCGIVHFQHVPIGTFLQVNVVPFAQLSLEEVDVQPQESIMRTELHGVPMDVRRVLAPMVKPSVP